MSMNAAETMIESALIAAAEASDADDALASLRSRFHIPQHVGADQAYFCGNSLGLQPKAVRAS